MHTDKFNRTLSFNTKLKYFFGAWALTEFLLLDAFNKFVMILNNKNIIHMGKDFDSSNILWGDSILPNVIKITIVCLFSFGFAITYSYLARKVRESDEVVLSLANAVMAVFGSIAIIVLIVWVVDMAQGKNVSSENIIVFMVREIKNNNLLAGVLLAQFIGAAISTYVGLNVGQKLTEPLDNEDKGKLLGIKWPHFIWLGPSIAIYFEALLFLIYLTLHTLNVFIHTTQLGDILGLSGGNGKANSVQSLFGALLFLYIIAVTIIYLLRLQRDILSGEMKTHKIWKILLSILVVFVIPFLLLFFTAIGDSGA